MGLGACFRRPRRRDCYLRPHDDDECNYSSPPPPLAPSSSPPSSYSFADWIKPRCLGGGNNTPWRSEKLKLEPNSFASAASRKRKVAAEAGSGDRDGRGRRPDRVRKLKKRQGHAGGRRDDINLQEFLVRSPSRKLPPPLIAAAKNRVHPDSQIDNNTGSFSLEMPLEIEEAETAVVNNSIDEVSSSRKRRVSFRLPEEGDIFTYDPSDDDEEEHLMIGVYYF
ncbi:unnamed protein product [Linum trigynum]|uniref:Uncharacterized protein n=1 Tax=Linum trigynum TaxID=586398 RepID=A0AAV2EFE4_9ROSI